MPPNGDSLEYTLPDDMTTTFSLYDIATTFSPDDIATTLTSRGRVLQRPGHGRGPFSLDEHCKIYLFFWDVIVEAFLVVFGFCGNALSIAVLWRDRKISCNAFLLTCLALVDDGVLLVFPLLKITPALCDFVSCRTKQYFYTLMRIYGFPLGHVIHMISSYLIVLISLQRYLAICKPHALQKWRTVKAAKLQAAIVVVFSCLFHFPKFIHYDIRRDNFGYHYKPSPFFDIEAYQYGYRVVTFNIFIYALPMAVLIYLNGNIVRSLRSAKKNRAAMQSSASSSNNNKEDITRAFLVVVIVYLVCQIPGPLRRVLENISTRQQKMCRGYMFYLNPFPSMFLVLNSSINFIIYCLFAPGFRARVKALFKRHNSVAPQTQSGSKRLMPAAPSPLQNSSTKLTVVSRLPGSSYI